MDGIKITFLSVLGALILALLIVIFKSLVLSVSIVSEGYFAGAIVFFSGIILRQLDRKRRVPKNTWARIFKLNTLGYYSIVIAISWIVMRISRYIINIKAYAGESVLIDVNKFTMLVLAVCAGLICGKIFRQKYAENNSSSDDKENHD